MEKRLQLLLDAHRWELVSREAERTQRSAASVIREAIDIHLSGHAQEDRRAAAAADLLDVLDNTDRGDADDGDTGDVLDRELADYIDKKLQV